MDEFDQFKASAYSGGGNPLQRGYSFPGLTVSEFEDDQQLRGAKSTEFSQDLEPNLGNMQHTFKSLNLGDSMDSNYDRNRLSVSQWTQPEGQRDRGMFLRCNSNPNPMTSPISPTSPRRPPSPMVQQHSVSPDSPLSSPHSLRIKSRMGGLQADRIRRRSRQASICRPDISQFRTLHHSMDSSRDRDNADGNNQVYRVRSFVTSPKGIINRGDSYRLRSFASNCSLESTASSPGGYIRTCSLASHGSYSTGSSMEHEQEGSSFRVVMLGRPGVGKSTLIQQFMTSEYLGNMEQSIDVEDEEKTISVMLDSEESFLSFVDGVKYQSLDTDAESRAPPIMPDADAYMLVYSVADLRSFQHIESKMAAISKDTKRDTAIIIVANKSDIVRNRTVTVEAGKQLATQHDCKYIEVSAGLNHKVDELLVGVLRQIRLKRALPHSSGASKCQEEANHEGPKGIVGRIFRRNSRAFRSCDNLMVS